MEERRKSTMLENHVQTIMVAITMALLTWVGMTLLDVRDRLSRMEVQQVGENSRDTSQEESIRDLQRRVRDIELKAAARVTP